MAIHITDNTMTLEVDNRVVATCGYGNGAWIVSAYPARLFTRDHAIGADNRRASGGGCPDSHPNWSRSEGIFDG
jgi:hypothetical protein